MNKSTITIQYVNQIDQQPFRSLAIPTFVFAYIGWMILLWLLNTPVGFKPLAEFLLRENYLN
jgi:hypothetical protein